MKKISVFLTMALIMICCLTGCGGREAYAGKWEASEIVVNNNSVTDLGGVPLSALVRFELDKNGSAKWESAMDGVKDSAKDGVSASWKVKDDKVIMKVTAPDSDPQEMEFEPRDGNLVMSQSGTEIILTNVDEYTPVDEETLSQIENMYTYGLLMGS